MGDITASYLSQLDPQKHFDPEKDQLHRGGGSGGSAVAKGKEIVTNELNKTAGSPFGGESCKNWKPEFFQRDVDSSTCWCTNPAPASSSDVG